MQRLQIEGSESTKDFSYAWVQGHQDLKMIEAAFPITQFSEEMERRDTEMEFRILRRLTETQYHNENLVEFHPDTQRLNRYNNILPCIKYQLRLLTVKHSLVNLKCEQDEEELKESYINANFVNSATGEKQIIATQGPMPTTINHFWRMIYQEKFGIVVMLCNLKENNKIQCEQYWPKQVGEFMLAGNITVKSDSNDDQGPSLVHRNLIVTSATDSKELKVTQIHWQGWSDMTVPQCSDYDIIFQIIKYIVDQMEKGVKVVFHCSAGVGRTGTLITLCNLVLILNSYRKIVNNDIKKIIDNPEQFKISIFGSVRRLREQRWGMVHTSEQYQYLYKFMDKTIKHFLNK